MLAREEWLNLRLEGKGERPLPMSTHGLCKEIRSRTRSCPYCDIGKPTIRRGLSLIRCQRRDQRASIARGKFLIEDGSQSARRNEAVCCYDGTHAVKFLPPVRKRTRMTDLGRVVAHLKAERSKIDKAIAALCSLDGRSGGGGKRILSAAARERIAAAQRARWAKVKAKKGK